MSPEGPSASAFLSSRKDCLKTHTRTFQWRAPLLKRHLFEEPAPSASCLFALGCWGLFLFAPGQFVTHVARRYMVTLMAQTCLFPPGSFSPRRSHFLSLCLSELHSFRLLVSVSLSHTSSVRTETFSVAGYLTCVSKHKVGVARERVGHPSKACSTYLRGRFSFWVFRLG